jgi:glutathione S-transferase
MRLVGAFISPFVRRVAVALNVLELPFEHEALSVVENRSEISSYNDLVRVPSLVLDDGEVMIDSNHILAELDRMVGPERALCPRQLDSLRAYGQILAYATGALEKFVAAFYEVSRRPPETVWPEWAARCKAQAIGGLMAMEARAPEGLGDGAYFSEGRLTHADIAAVIAYQTGVRTDPGAVNPASLPRLARLTTALGPTPAFAATSP